MSMAFNQSMTWKIKNKLTMNTSKTKAMFFGTEYTTSQIQNPEIRAGETEIEAIDHYKYLG